MKTQSISLFRLLKPVLVFSALTLSILGFTAYVSAAEIKPKPSAIEQTKKIVNLNSANAQSLSEVLKGIGLKKAEAIVAWRKQNGKFMKVEQLLEIKGIGEKTLSANRGRISL